MTNSIKFINTHFLKVVMAEKLINEPSSLKELKEEYHKLSRKYHIPDFNELNKQFDVEDVQTDTDFLLRRIRKIILEKITNYSRFIELILNPSTAPMFFFKLVRKLEPNDREKLSKIYEILGNLETQVIHLDLDCSEDKEARFIQESFEVFNKKIKFNLLAIIDKLMNGNNDYQIRNSGSYLG